MSEDLVVRTTVDFILGSAKNLDLALQVEEAMPQLRADVIGEFLKGVEAELSTSGWRVHKPNVDLLKAKARLELCGLDWPMESDPADRTSIGLGTDSPVWGRAFVGVYLSKMLRDRIRENKQEIMPALKQALARLPNEQGWMLHDLSQEHGWSGWAIYRYFDEPLRNWGGAQFLRNSLDSDCKRKMVAYVVDLIEMLKPGACALVRAAAPSA